jgi:hypothetical protein
MEDCCSAASISLAPPRRRHVVADESVETSVSATSTTGTAWATTHSDMYTQSVQAAAVSRVPSHQAAYMYHANVSYDSNHLRRDPAQERVASWPRATPRRLGLREQPPIEQTTLQSRNSPDGEFRTPWLPPREGIRSHKHRRAGSPRSSASFNTSGPKHSYLQAYSVIPATHPILQRMQTESSRKSDEVSYNGNDLDTEEPLIDASATASGPARTGAVVSNRSQ